MIPLRTTEPVRKFPVASTVLVLLWLMADLLSRLAPGTHREFLMRWVFVPASPQWRSLGAIVFHAGFFQCCVTALYAWVFTPRLFERRGVLVSLLIGLSGAALAFYSYRLIHHDSGAPILAPEAVLGALLGAFMCKDIWGSVNAFVIGPGWARVLEVPSYVLLFFWLFYLLVGNLLTASPFSDAPAPYWIPFISFIWGFLADFLWDILVKWTSSSSSSAKSARKRSSSEDSFS